MDKRGTSLQPKRVITITKQNPAITPAAFAYKPTEKDSVAPTEPKEEKKVVSGDRELTELNGKPLPALIATDLSFQKVKINDIIDKPTLITLWATWCGPCLKEMPFFQKLADKYKGKFQVLAVATNEENAASIGFIKKHPEYKFTFLLDPEADTESNIPVNGARKTSALRKALGDIGALPINLLVDANGKIVSAFLGERKEAEWTDLIDKLVTK